MMLKKAKEIKLVILDVDGVLTDGLLYYGHAGEELKAFNVKDGLGIRLLQDHGIEVALITGRTSKIVTARAEELRIQKIYQGRIDKLFALEDLLKNSHYQLQEIACMGDDIIDLPILSRVGLAAAPKNAHPRVLKEVHFVSEHDGGQGAVREFADLILQAQNKLEAIINNTLKYGKILRASPEHSSC